MGGGGFMFVNVQLGVSKNRGGPPKWMVKIMENPIQMDDLGGTIIFGNTQFTTTKGRLDTTETTNKIIIELVNTMNSNNLT